MSCLQGWLIHLRDARKRVVPPQQRKAKPPCLHQSDLSHPRYGYQSDPERKGKSLWARAQERQEPSQWPTGALARSGRSPWLCLQPTPNPSGGVLLQPVVPTCLSWSTAVLLELFAERWGSSRHCLLYVLRTLLLPAALQPPQPGHAATHSK